MCACTSWNYVENSGYAEPDEDLEDQWKSHVLKQSVRDILSLSNYCSPLTNYPGSVGASSCSSSDWTMLLVHPLLHTRMFFVVLLQQIKVSGNGTVALMNDLKITMQLLEFDPGRVSYSSTSGSSLGTCFIRLPRPTLRTFRRTTITLYIEKKSATCSPSERPKQIQDAPIITCTISFKFIYQVEVFMPSRQCQRGRATMGFQKVLSSVHQCRTSSVGFGSSTSIWTSTFIGYFSIRYRMSLNIPRCRNNQF